MSNFSEALANAARSGVCQVLSVPSYINDALQRVNFFPFDSARRAIPDFWRNMLCDRPAPTPNPAPFTGGQCPGVNYAVTVAISQNGTVVSRTTVTGIGPVLGLRIEETDNSSPANPDGKIRQAFVRFGGSVEQSAGTGNEDTPIFIENVTRPDGLPDNCGNPDPEYEELEPDDVTINTDFTYNDFSGTSITVPVVLVYARATVDARANIIIPFTANINGALSVNGAVNLNGDVDINIGTAGGSGLPKDPRKSPCGDISLPDGEVPEDPTDNDQPDEPDREEERVIKGALVTVTSVQNIRSSVIGQDENPDIYAPSLGHINFLCRVGVTSGGWTVDLPVKNRRNLIPCPWDEGAVAVRGTPQPGVTWVITPVYGLRGAPVEYVQ